MKKNLINNVPLFFGVLFLFIGISNIMEPNYGFTSVEGGEGIGYNASMLITNLIGPILVYKGLKKNRNVNVVDNQNGNPKTKSISRDIIYCTKCGAKQEKDAKFCTNCGFNLIQ